MRGVPGPVFLEVPVDVLYPEATVREMFMKEGGFDNPKTLGQRAVKLYLTGHLYRQFHAPHLDVKAQVPEVKLPRVHQNGSPGLFGFTPLNQRRMYIDNLSVTQN